MLVTGACGQVGAELVPFLRDRLGRDAVVASDVRPATGALGAPNAGPFVRCNVVDSASLEAAVVDNGITYIVHLASVLSAAGEANPQAALRVNLGGTHNVLDLAVKHKLQVCSRHTE